MAPFIIPEVRKAFRLELVCMHPKRYLATALAVLTLSLASCQPPDRDIRVVWRQGQLVIDFPWSIRRLIGLQGRDWCLKKIELFDSAQLLWTLEMSEESQRRRSCLDVTMPVVIGRNMPGFVGKGLPRLGYGETYGVAVAGTGNGRVDFVLRGQRTPENISGWDNVIDAPCGSYFSSCQLPKNAHLKVLSSKETSPNLDLRPPLP